MDQGSCTVGHHIIEGLDVHPTNMPLALHLDSLLLQAVALSNSWHMNVQNSDLRPSMQNGLPSITDSHDTLSSCRKLRHANGYDMVHGPQLRVRAVPALPQIKSALSPSARLQFRF